MAIVAKLAAMAAPEPAKERARPCGFAFRIQCRRLNQDIGVERNDRIQIQPRGCVIGRDPVEVKLHQLRGGQLS